MGGYENEQNQLTSEVAKLESRLVSAASNESDVSKWIDLIKGFIHLDDLDRAAAVMLINCIEVSEQFDENEQRQQNITIKYNFVGNMPENPINIGKSA